MLVPTWSPTLVPPVTAAPEAGRAWSKGAFPPTLHHPRRALEGLWLLSFPLGAFSPPPACLDGLGVGGKMIFMAPCLQYPKAMSWEGGCRTEHRCWGCGWQHGGGEAKAFYIPQRLCCKLFLFPVETTSFLATECVSFSFLIFDYQSK